MAGKERQKAGGRAPGSAHAGARSDVNGGSCDRLGSLWVVSVPELLRAV